ncbi:MAG: hypothetical protein HY788_17045 [Deltaproteobacteria bacterium]|nr:hypothetical protein [Deltaproteobacteria bacterium]
MKAKGGGKKVQLGSLFRSLFSPFFYPDRRQGDQREAKEGGGDDGRFAGQKLTVDMRYRDFSFSLSKSKLKGFLKRPSDGESPQATVDTEPLEVGYAGQAVDPVATNQPSNHPGIAYLIERLNRLYGTVKEVANRMQRLEERILPVRNKDYWPGFNPDQGVLVASVLGEQEKELLLQRSMGVEYEQNRAYRTIRPETFIGDRKLDVVA